MLKKTKTILILKKVVLIAIFAGAVKKPFTKKLKQRLIKMVMLYLIK